MQTGIGKWLHEQDGFGVFELNTMTAIFWVFATAGVSPPLLRSLATCRWGMLAKSSPAGFR